MTSRRFCDFCEIEQKQHDLLPKAAMGLALLIGAAGLTAYLSGNADSVRSSSDRESTAQVRELKAGAKTIQPLPPSNIVQTNRSDSATLGAPATAPNAVAVNSEQRGPLQSSSTEPVYYCGAVTKKGTGCTRRVKTKGRCWQHVGQSAIRETRD